MWNLSISIVFLNTVAQDNRNSWTGNYPYVINTDYSILGLSINNTKTSDTTVINGELELFELLILLNVLIITCSFLVLIIFIIPDKSEQIRRNALNHLYGSNYLKNQPLFA